jgi:DNA polymerase-4
MLKAHSAANPTRKAVMSSQSRSQSAFKPRKIFLHADMDAFYASIEQRDNPSYRGKPVIVGARPGTRGVVSAASYEARAFGIHSAMPISQAYRRCPRGIYVRPRMRAYSAESEKVMDILQTFSPLVEPISIDEAFVDMTGTEKLWGGLRQSAEAVSEKIRTTLNLTVSIGVAPNKFLAKIASDLNKPNGITITPFSNQEIIEWLAPMPVSRIWGVGAKTQSVLETIAIRAIGDLQQMPLERLENLFGRQGEHLHELCRGIDARGIDMDDEVKSISREHTFPADSSDLSLWHATLLSLSRDVAARARARQCKGSTVVLTYRTPDFQRRSRRTTLSEPTNLAHQIYGEAVKLLKNARQRTKSLRLIGVGITNLGDVAQTDLFSDQDEENAWEASEAAMDSIARRYGDSAIFLGGESNARKKRSRKRGKSSE